MVDLKVKDGEFGKIVRLSDERKDLDIFMGGNLDLYFAPVVRGIELLESDDPFVFKIDRSNIEVYNAFDNLYNKVVSYNPFDRSESEYSGSKFRLDEEVKFQKYIDSKRGYPLVKNGVISWHSDDLDPDYSSVLNISKKDDSYELEFVKSRDLVCTWVTNTVRFRNSGSSYDPFNLRFMELYRSLYSLDKSVEEEKEQVEESETYHQITLEEYFGRGINPPRRKVLTRYGRFGIRR